MNRDNGQAAARNTIPIHWAVTAQPKLLGVTAQASIGTKTKPPKKEPYPAIPIAAPRLALNQWFRAVIMGSQEPAVTPSMIKK